VGQVPLVLHRPLEGVMKNVTVSKTKSGKYLISLQVEVQITEPAFTGGVVGIDLGVRDFATLSGAEQMERPQYDRKAQRKRRRLAKSIGDAGWSQFVELLKYKGAWYGCRVKKVSRWYPSTKTCPNCGRVVEELPMGVRQWQCPYCGKVHDRDVNAAVNIKTEALRGLEETPAGAAGSYAWGQDVRPSQDGNAERTRKPTCLSGW
jgi:putative transposase